MSSRLIFVGRCSLKWFREMIELETRGSFTKTRHLNRNVFVEQRNNAQRKVLMDERINERVRDK